jgi:Ran GTPase-activating protein (RanGAP) involved in mRNA processing and transport
MNQYITKLDLASNGLGDEGVFYLSHILRDNVAIVDINLSQNFIGIDGARELCNLFKESHIAINHLKLEGKKNTFCKQKNEIQIFIYLGNLLDDKCAYLLSEAISVKIKRIQ